MKNTIWIVMTYIKRLFDFIGDVGIAFGMLFAAMVLAYLVTH